MSSPALKLPGKYCKATYKENFWEWDVDNMHGLPLELINFGAGPAFNVSVNWLVDMKELLKAINQLDSKMDGMLQIGNTFHNIKLQKNFMLFQPTTKKKLIGFGYRIITYVLSRNSLTLKYLITKTWKLQNGPHFPVLWPILAAKI